MKSYEKLKKEKISHLQWCLDTLKLKEDKLSEEDYIYLYRYIFCTIQDMENMESLQANEYYRKRMYAKNIKYLLSKCNIELSV